MARRDYKAEYRRRIKRGLKRGLTKAQARGHAKPLAHDAHPNLKQPVPPKADKRLDAAILEMNRGRSLTAAARAAHVSAERLRTFLRANKLGRKKNRRWAPRDDRPRRVLVTTRGGLRVVFVAGYEPARLVGEHHHAASAFVRSNDIELLKPFEGKAVRSIDGNPVLRKASAHGLGHLMDPYPETDAPNDLPRPLVPIGDLGLRRWQHDLWIKIVQAAIDGNPERVALDWHSALSRPAAMRYTASSPAQLAWLKVWNAGKPYDEQIRPFGFLLAFMPRTGLFATPQLVAAREKARVARALEQLPEIADAFAKGEISYSKVRAMTRVATSANESVLVHIARNGTAVHVEKLVRKYSWKQRRDAAQLAQRQHEFRRVSWSSTWTASSS